jgi:Carboxypeptidase regulatory-like domain/TonB-dependent Receptor Plug Domain
MKGVLRVFITVCLAIAFSGIAIGQELTGEIRGTVKDQAGAVVPNVTVNIKGVNVGFNRSVQTDQRGTYSAQQIPPGVYTVSTEATSGFAAQTKENVQVGLGNATTVDFSASTAEISAVVNIQDTGVLVDATETKAQDNISAREIEALPKGTGFTSLLRTTAAVRPEPLGGQFSINGSTGPENSFIIDGQETQNYKNGLLNTNNDIPFQALQEIQVKTSGFEAEFGGATGGVISGVTKSGSNEFHGEFGMAFNTRRLNARPRPVLALTNSGSVAATGQFLEYFQQQRDSGTDELPTAILSGPVIKDKLWFFGIHNPRVVNITRTTNFVQGFGATRAPRALSAALLALGASPTQTATEKIIYNYSSLRLDAAPTNSLRISSSFTWNPIVDKGALLGGTIVNGSPAMTRLAGVAYQGSQLAARQGGRQNSNNFRVEGVWLPTSKIVANLRYTRGFQNQKLNSYGIADEPRFICQQVSAALVAVAGCSQAFQNVTNNDIIRKDISIRSTIDANVGYSFNGLGRHDFKGGYERSKIFNDVFTGSVLKDGGHGRAYLYYGVGTAGFDCHFVYIQFQIPCPAGGGLYPLPTGLPPGVTVVGTGLQYQFGASGTANNTADTLFFQDKWQPTSRLTLNLGLRMEQEKIPAFNTTHIDLKWSWKDKLAPRLGVAYALTADGKTKISAFYGRFFDRLKFSLPQGSFGGNFYHTDYFYITSNHQYNFYSPANLHGSFNWPNGGQCPIALTNPNGYLCDQDWRIASNIPGADVLTNGAVDPNVKPYRQSEYTFEFQREAMRATVLTARYLYRNLDETIEDAGVPTASGEAYVIGNPGKGLAASVYKQLGYNKAAIPERKYNAFQLEVDTRYVRNFNLNLNYTLSRLKGNYSGLANPDELNATGGGRTDPNVSRGFDEPWVGFTASGHPDNGVLPLDRTHVFKASGTYTYDWWFSKMNSTDLSFFTTAQSGTPRTTFVNIFGIPIPETKRGDLGRTPMFTQTDLNLTHRIRFGNDRRFAIAFDFNVINVFNEANKLAFNQNKSSAYFALDQTDVVASGDTAAATNVLTSSGVLSQYSAAVAKFATDNGVPAAWATNLAFGNPISFQEPRQVRFGFRFLF